MKKIKHLAEENPLAFAFVITLIFILLVLISSAVPSAAWPGDTSEWFLGATTGRLVSMPILFLVLSRLGWSRSSGLTRPGRWVTWLTLLFPLAYAVLVAAYSMTGNLDFSFSEPGVTGVATLFLMFHAFLEEIAFRGLILHGFARRWGGSNRGLIRSVLVSALFFGVYHIIYLAGEPLPVVLWRIVSSFLLGIFLGALYLSGRSIYPPAFFHGILNLAGYLNLTSNGVEGTTSAWLLMSLLMIPLAVFGVFLLRVVPDRAAIPETAKGVA